MYDSVLIWAGLLGLEHHTVKHPLLPLGLFLLQP